MQNLCVLIVEDDAIIALLLNEILEDLGHRVCATAATEDDAVAAAGEHMPDLIIADAGLRIGSGIDAVATIGQIRAVPCVFVTGNAALVRSRMPGAVVLQKPFFLPELEAAIAAAVARVDR